MYFFNPDRIMTDDSKMSFDQKISVLQEQLANADAVVIGAGSGIRSSCAGTNGFAFCIWNSGSA